MKKKSGKTLMQKWKNKIGGKLSALDKKKLVLTNIPWPACGQQCRRGDIRKHCGGCNRSNYTDCGCPGGYGVRGFVPAIHGNDVDQCYHAHSVNYHYGNLVRKNDRNLPLYFHSTNSVCHHDQ